MLVILGLVALAIVLLPIVAFVRTLQIGSQLADLRRRLDHLERRVDSVEPVVPRPAPARPIVPPPPISPSVVPPLVVPPPAVRVESPPAQPPAARDLVAALPSDVRDLDLEERIGGRWLQHAGLIVLLLGIAFFLRYAFEHEWLSPAVRIVLGIVAGISMSWGGVRLAVRYRAYGLLLSGGGIAVLYLSLYAGLNLYALYGPEVAFAMLVVVTIAAAALADHTGSQAIAVIAVCGGFATPFLVGGRGDQQIRLFSYVALLIASTMYLAHRRRWRWLNVVSLALTMLTVAAWADTYYTDAKYLRTELFLTLYCAMFIDIIRRSWSKSPDAALFVSALMLGPLAYHVWSVVTLTPHGLAFLIYLIAFTALTVMLGVHERSTLVRAASFIAMVLPMGAWIQAHHWRGWVLTSCAAIAGIYAMHLAAQMRAVTGDEEFDEREVALLHATGVGVYVALYQVLIDTLSIEALTGLALLLAVVNAAIWAVFRRVAPIRALHWLGVAFTLVATAVWLQFGGPWAVAIWATEGAVVFWMALRADSRWLRAGAWVLLALAAFRWGQSDIQQTTTSYQLLLNARAMTGLYLVALLYFAAWKGKAAERSVLMIAASILTVIVMSSEIVSFWNLRSGSADALVAREMMLSASWVAYAALLVVLGMRRKYAPIRYFAIALFGIALLKVFFVDLETLGGIYRVAGFLVVGLILLVVSFLYQRNAANERPTRSPKASAGPP
jgi:uncharacterized membrane protein